MHHLIVLGLFIFITSPVYGQMTWLTQTSDNCKLTIDYPSTWTIEERKGASGAELKISDKNIVKAGLPALIFTTCLKYDSLVDMATLDVYANTFLYAILDSNDPLYQIVNYSHLVKNFINGRDAEVFAVVTANKNTTNLEMEAYTVMNGTMLYQFTYSDLADHFNTPESKQVREHIWKSIRLS